MLAKYSNIVLSYLEARNQDHNWQSLKAEGKSEQYHVYSMKLGT